MDVFLHFGLNNVMFACLLALLAWGVTRVGKNPHLNHALWLLVLVKLVTPPVWSIPVSLPNLRLAAESPTASGKSFEETGRVRSMTRLTSTLTDRSGDVSHLVHRPEKLTSIQTGRDVVNRDRPAGEGTGRQTAFSWSEESQVDFVTVIGSLWLLTSGLWALAVVWRVVRFQRIVRAAEYASPDLVKRARRLAKMLELRNYPELRVVDGNLSPMIWPLSRRCTILLPKRLFSEITLEQLDTVIIHELAHLVRRDDLVRILEAVVTCLFWWNPLVWWTRRELRSAEEDCCDALVVCTLPDVRQQYGAALLQVAEMISFGRSLPVLATPFGQQRSLKRRIEMILTQKYRRSASWRTKLAVFALMIAVLPFVATAVSIGESGKRGDSAEQLSVAAKAPRAKKGNSKKPAAGGKARQDVARKVVAHWRFQKGLNGGVANSSQLIEDSSGNDHHGRAVGGPKYRSVKLPGSNLALTFDGHDDRLFVPDDESFHLTKSMTIEAYIQINLYPGSAAKFSQIVFRGDNRMGFDPWFLAVRESGQLQFLVADALNNASFVRSPEPIPTGQLVHVAGTLDDKTGKLSLFINGKRVATTKTKIRACGALGGSAPGIGIGNRQEYSNHAFRGTIDEVRISAEALSPTQMLPPAKIPEG